MVKAMFVRLAVGFMLVVLLVSLAEMVQASTASPAQAREGTPLSCADALVSPTDAMCQAYASGESLPLDAYVSTTAADMAGDYDAYADSSGGTSTTESATESTHAAIGVQPTGAGHGYGDAYWSAVHLFVSVDNDTYSAMFYDEGTSEAQRNVMFRAAYDSVSGQLYEDFSYEGSVVSYGAPSHVWPAYLPVPSTHGGDTILAAV